jgi:hypothetical protein
MFLRGYKPIKVNVATLQATDVNWKKEKDPAYPYDRYRYSMRICFL